MCANLIYYEKMHCSNISLLHISSHSEKGRMYKYSLYSMSSTERKNIFFVCFRSTLAKNYISFHTSNSCTFGIC